MRLDFNETRIEVGYEFTLAVDIPVCHELSCV